MKMNRVLNAAMILIISVMSLNSCKKDETAFHSINSDMKKAFNYQVGTYWILKDSVTGDLDSMYVYENKYNPKFTSTLSSFDEIGIYIHLPFMGSGVRDTTNFFFTLFENSSGLQYNSKLGYDSFFEYPFKTSQHTKIYPALTINGNSYNNVCEIHLSGSLSFYGILYDDWYYFNQENGFLKIRLVHSGGETFNRVYELVNSKLILL